MAAPRLKLADETTTAPTRRTRFTIKALEAVKTPAKGDTVLHDDVQRGLTFRVRDTGARTFYLVKKHKGRVIRYKVGDFPGTTIEQARKVAVAKITDMNNDIDPMAQRRQERAEKTIGGVWAAYQRDHHPRCSPRTARQDVWLFNAYLTGIESRRLGDLPQSAVKGIHTAASKASKTSANRAVQLLRRLYNYASKHHEYTGKNPTCAIEMFPERSRERFLSVDELPRFIAACDAEGQPWADFFKLCLFVGARRSNVQMMRWKAIDLQAQTWTIDGSESKNGTDMVIPLTAPAIEILKRRADEQAKVRNERIRTSAYVFPALRVKGERLHISQPARPFDRICKAAKIEGVTIHDLRRTAGAWLAASGASLPTIGRMLGHRDLRATQIYARMDIDPVRTAMEGVAAAMIATPKVEGAK